MAENPVARLRFPLVDSWRVLRPWIPRRGLVITVTPLLGALAGLLEAGILGVAAMLASALAGGVERLSMVIGGYAIEITFRDGLIVAAVTASMRLLIAPLRAYIPGAVGSFTASHLRQDLSDAFMHARWEVQDAEPEGRLQEILGNHVERAMSSIGAGLNAITFATNALILLIAALIVSPGFAVVTVVVGAALTRGLRPLVRYSRTHAAAMADVSVEAGRLITEARRLSTEATTYGVRASFAEGLRANAERLRGYQRRVLIATQFVLELYQGLVLLLIVVGLAIASFVGGDGLAALGAVLLIMVRVLTYSQQAYGAYQQCSNNAPFAEKVMAALSEYREAEATDGDVPLETIRSLSLDGIGLRYKGRAPVLRGVDLVIDVGDAVGVVGPSGSGKTSLAHMLLLLREPSEGRVLVNGKDAMAYRRTDWHRLVAVVPQQPRLLSGTVRDNIIFRRPDITFAQVERAASLAGLTADVNGMPDGFDTQVGAGSGELSGGQIQRVGIARALAGEPEFVVLDEPTSALDVASESIVLETLVKLRGQVTLLVIAHRASTLRACSRLLLVQDAAVRELPLADLDNLAAAFLADEARA